MPKNSPLNRRCFVLGSAAVLAAAGLPACSDKTAETNAAAATAASGAAAAKPSARESYELASQGNGFTMGSVMAANTVYVFFDSTCPHCAALWASSKPLLTKLKMVWMPIGLLHRSSAPQGATILSAADPAAAMTENETSVLERKGGISVPPSLSDEMLAKVKANTDLFAKLGADSVPLIVFKNAKTGQYGSFSGSLQTDQLAAMVGV
jgi:thiol:disulfide interchange protein DsbG